MDDTSTRDWRYFKAAMPTTQAELEQRIKELEQQVAELEAAQEWEPVEDGYHEGRIVADDECLYEACGVVVAGGNLELHQFRYEESRQVEIQLDGLRLCRRKAKGD